jgi:hypothetical protein
MGSKTFFLMTTKQKVNQIKIKNKKKIKNLIFKNEENEKEKKEIIIEDSLETSFCFMTTRSSSFLLSSGIFVLSFIVDEGNGKFFEAKSIIHKQVPYKI